MDDDLARAPCQVKPCMELELNKCPEFRKQPSSALLFTRCSPDGQAFLPRQPPTMRFTQSIAPALLLLAAGVAQAASGWGFGDGSIQIAAKKGESVKEKYAALHTEFSDADRC